MSRFLKVRAQDEQFFTQADGSPVTRYQFSALFKRCLVAVGVEAKEYGLHSFLIGVGTEAVRGLGYATGEMEIAVLHGVCPTGTN